MTDFLTESNKIINELLSLVVSLVPEEGWTNLKLTLTFPDRTTMQAVSEYTKNTNIKPFSILENTEVINKAWEIEKLYYSKEKGRLTKATFNINGNGKFDINMEYGKEN